MSRSFAYDDRYDPPAPMVPLRVSNPTGVDGVLLTVLVDTGADATVIPESVAEQLGLPVVGYAEITGVGGAKQEIAMHAAVVHLAGVEIMLRVAAFEGERLVGRDLLGHLVARLDGPRRALSFELGSPEGYGTAFSSW